MTEEIVERQPHYNMGTIDPADGRAMYEPIKVFRDRGWHFAFCMANAAKYLNRSEHKDQRVKDLGKIRTYLEWACKDVDEGFAFVAPKCARKLASGDAVRDWGLDDERLISCALAVLDGDPYEALEHLNVYFLRPEENL